MSIILFIFPMHLRTGDTNNETLPLHAQLGQVVRRRIAEESRNHAMHKEYVDSKHDRYVTHSHMAIIADTLNTLQNCSLRNLEIGYIDINNKKRSRIAKSRSYTMLPRFHGQFDPTRAYHEVLTLLQNKADPHYISTYPRRADIIRLRDTIYPELAHCTHWGNMREETYHPLTATDIACLALSEHNLSLPKSIITDTHHHLSDADEDSNLYTNIFLHALELYRRGNQSTTEIRKSLRTQREPQEKIGLSDNVSIVNSILSIPQWDLPTRQPERRPYPYNLTSPRNTDHPITPGVDDLEEALLEEQSQSAYTAAEVASDIDLELQTQEAFFPDVYKPSPHETYELGQFIQEIEPHDSQYFQHIIRTAWDWSIQEPMYEKTLAYLRKLYPHNKLKISDFTS